MSTEKHENILIPEALLAELYYPSESDEPIDYVEFEQAATTPLTAESLRALTGASPEDRIEEITEERFWEPVITEQDWFGEEEKAVTARFRQLQAEVACQLTDRQVFRVGETEIDVYLLGKNAAGNWAGLKTRVVET